LLAKNGFVLRGELPTNSGEPAMKVFCRGSSTLRAPDLYVAAKNAIPKTAKSVARFIERTASV
jgi:hypothetical protein